MQIFYDMRRSCQDSFEKHLAEHAAIKPLEML